MGFDYQLVVIGGGSGGLTVAAGAASFGAKVALVERKKQLGGDCLHYGCMPSKALIQAAKEVQEASKYMDIKKVEYNALFEGAMTRVKESVQEVQDHDSKDRFINLGIDLYEAEAVFEDEHTIRVGAETITAKRFVIATGSSPFVPHIDGMDNVGYLTNESIFALHNKPESLAVIGGGVIGVELSQAMSRLGVDVTMIEGNEHILSKEDDEIVQIAERSLSEQLHILTNAKAERVHRDGKGIHILYTKDGVQNEIHTDQLLVATGRKPNIENLELDKIGVKTDEEGFIKVDEFLRTSRKHIYAVGDCNGSMPFTHVAGMEGKIAVSNAVLGLARKVSYKKIPWIVYTDPEIYHLGLTEKEARKKYGENLMTFKTLLKDNDRFMAERKKEGLVKVLTTRRGKIVGAHAIGDGAGEWMQEIGTVQALNKKFPSISSVIHPYPAKNNVVSQTADLYWREKLFGSKWNEVIRWYVRKWR